jgi:hypothetical protein
VLINGPNSSTISNTGDFRSVRVYGPAAETLEVFEGIPTSFFIDVSNAGAGLIGKQEQSLLH